MESFAFWCTRRNNSANTPSIDVVANFNLWMPNVGKGNPVLDVGFKISHVSYESQKQEAMREERASTICGLIEAISFYCPFQVDSSEVEDLSNVMKKPEVAGAIFNENCTVEANDSYLYDVIKPERDGPDARFYLCNCNSEKPACHPRSKGTEIRIRLNQENADDIPIYVRFRIDSPGLRNITIHSKAKDRLLTSAFTKEDVIDFRFNDYRTMDAELVRIIDGIAKENVTIEHMQVHFLLMTKAIVDVKHWSELKEVRPLERHIWSSYLPASITLSASDTRPENTEVAWHWKSTKDTAVDGYKLYLLLQSHVSNFKTIIMYLLILLIITIVFDAISEHVRSLLSDKCRCQPTPVSRLSSCMVFSVLRLWKNV